MLGLADEIFRHNLRVSGLVRDDADFGWSGKHVDADSADMNVARFSFPENHPDEFRASVYQNKDFRIGLSSTDQSDLVEHW